MSAQDMLNVVGGVLMAGIGWWMNNMWAMVKSLQEQISNVHVKLVENYVPRVEMQDSFDRIFRKLDEIQREIKK